MLYYFCSYIHMENKADGVETMYLSTIPNIKRQIINKKSQLDVSDIEGARSRFIEHPKPQRDNPLHPYELEKSHPRQLIPQIVSKPNFLLQVDDIQGTRTKVNKFTTTRHTNPLDPQYQSPKVEFLPYEEPKFIRDNMAIDDIEGVRSRETFAIKLERAGKSINLKEEIVSNIKPTAKGFVRTQTSPIFNSLFTEDINKGERACPAKIRQTNPIEPVYNIAGEKGYGRIDGSKSSTKFTDKALRPNNSLQTEDIQGAKPTYNNFICEKKDEITGSKPQTLKRGISSNRKTNPLQPRYNYPGWSENSQGSHFTRPKTAHQRFDQFIK